MDGKGIVRDSSIWSHAETMAAFNRTDAMIRVGVVKAVFNDAITNEIRVLVGVNSNGREIPMNCAILRRFGGVYNYEDFIPHGYNYQDAPDSIAGYNAKAGDAVLVGQLNGQGRDGIILGGLTHAARTTAILATGGPQYKAEFNGVQTSINADGEWVLTFRGQPTNLDKLNDTPSQPIAPPIYDLKVGGSFMKFDKAGGWTVSDASQSTPQSIYIDKAGGNITATANNKFSLNTQNFLMMATSTATINSPKIAIGNGGTELLDKVSTALGDIVDFLNNTDSTHTHLGNLGYPTGAPITASMFTQLASNLKTIKEAIDAIKGSL